MYLERIVEIEELSILVYVSKEDDTIWLTQKEIGRLYEKSKTWVYKYLNIVINDADNRGHNDGHVVRFADTIGHSGGHPVQFLDKVTAVIDGKRITLYSLDVAVKLGEFIQSNRGLLLRNAIKGVVEEKISKTPSNILIYDDGRIKIDVNVSPEEETVWLNQNQIALLFDTTQQNISFHINNIIKENELDYNSVHKDFLYTDSVRKDFLYTASDGKQYSVTFYNLDMILAIGYRVKGKKAIEFRKWVSSILSQYLFKGYAIDRDRVTIANENFANMMHEINSIKKEIKGLKEASEHQMLDEKIIYEGTILDSWSLISRIVETANISIVLIDPYVDVRTLTAFQSAKTGVEILFITSSKSKLNQIEIDEFNVNNGKLEVKIDDRYHDRYLVIDDLIFYHLGASVNYLGTRFSQIDKVTADDIIEVIRKRITFQK